MPLAEPGIQVITLSLLALATLLSLANLVLGLFSTLTGKDPLPKRVRSMMRRIPASAADFRIRGTSLMLNGAGVMLIASNLATTFVERLAFGTATAYVPSGSAALPNDITFLFTTVAAVAAVALFIGAYALSRRVGYVSTHLSASAKPGMPPA